MASTNEKATLPLSLYDLLKTWMVDLKCMIAISANMQSGL